MSRLAAIRSNPGATGSHPSVHAKQFDAHCRCRPPRQTMNAEVFLTHSSAYGRGGTAAVAAPRPKYRTTAEWQVAVTDAQTRVNGRHGTHVVAQAHALSEDTVSGHPVAPMSLAALLPPLDGSQHGICPAPLWRTDVMYYEGISERVAWAMAGFVRTTVFVSEDLYAALATASASGHMSMAWVTRDALRAYLSDEGRPSGMPSRARQSAKLPKSQ